MWPRFSPLLKKAITAALEGAGQEGCDEASARHLLRAITSDAASAGFFILEDQGISASKLADQLDRAQATPCDGPARFERAGRLSSSAMHVLDVAAAEADRRRDRHIGTEHVVLSLALSNSNSPSAMLKELGLTHEGAETSLRRWRRLGSSRRQGREGRSSILSPALRRLFAPFRRLGHYPALAWNVYVRKSLGHPGFVTDPYPLYAKLRATEPVRRDPLAPVWVITTYAETMAMLRDPRFKKDPFASERLPRIVRDQLGVPDATAGRASAEMVSMLFLDPPEHTRVRGIFTKAFTPRRLEHFRPKIEQITQRLLDHAEQRAAGRGGGGVIDLVRDLAYPLPVTVIAELLGFPPEDYEYIKRWSDEMTEALALNPTEVAQARAYRAREEIRNYFNIVTTQLKDQPGDNLISALLTGEAYGQSGERLNPDELFSNSILLLAAGHETTTGLISNGMLALLRHPDQLRDLRKHMDDLIAPAVEELLRYDPPVQWTSRVAGENIVLQGREIQRGEIVLASVAAANRDPAVFPDPDRLDIRRAENKHLSFGTGIHFCLGAALARWEAQAAIKALLMRYPHLELARRRVRWRKGITFRGPVSLPVRLGYRPGSLDLKAD